MSSVAHAVRVTVTVATVQMLCKSVCEAGGPVFVFNLPNLGDAEGEAQKLRSHYDVASAATAGGHRQGSTHPSTVTDGERDHCAGFANSVRCQMGTGRSGVGR